VPLPVCACTNRIVAGPLGEVSGRDDVNTSLSVAHHLNL
jgi:hypothetical protein